MTQEISIRINCPDCEGTGIRASKYDRKEGVMCERCDGTGCTKFTYIPFSERKKDRDHLTVFLESYYFNDIGKRVRTKTRPSIEYRTDFSLAERAEQRWDTLGTIYEMNSSKFGRSLRLVAHDTGGLAWYGTLELNILD
jgi:hypothetical protein